MRSQRRSPASTTRAVDPQACVANAERFDREVFDRELPREVERALREARGEERPPHAMTPRVRGARRGLIRPLVE